MTTNSTISSRRFTVATIIAIGFAVLVSMFAAAPQAEARELRAAPDDGVAELTPDEWDCILNYEVEHVDFCIRLKEKPTKSQADTQSFSAAPTRDLDNGGPDFLCPGGTVATPFEQPIYDENDLFVVGYETVWFCIPVDVEPAG